MPEADAPLKATINIRVTEELRDLVDQAAEEDATDRSKWVTKVIEDALRMRVSGPVSRGRTVVVQRVSRMTTPGSVPSRFCNHPMALRSEPNPKTRETVCLACRATFKPLG